MTRLRWLLIGVAFAKGLLLAALIPPFQTPDEYAHVDYALYLAHIDALALVRGEVARPTDQHPNAYATRELRCLTDATGTTPHLTDAVLPRAPWRLSEMFERARGCDRLDSHDALAAVQTVNSLYSYPPLYYAVLAAIHRMMAAAYLNPLAWYYAARLLSLGLFLLTLVAAVGVLKRLGLDDPSTTLGLAILALHPQLSMLSVAIQPDVLGTLLITLTLLGALALRCGFSAARVVVAAVTLGLLVITKQHLAVPMALVLATMWLVALWRSPGLRPALWRAGGIGLTCVLVTGGWYPIRSILRYGNAIAVVHPRPLDFSATTLFGNLCALFDQRMPTLIDSYWGMWGWLDYTYPAAMRPWLVALSVAPGFFLALVAATRRASRGRPHSASDGTPQLDGWAWSVVGGALVVFLVEMLAVTALLGPVVDQGRHYLPYAVAEAAYFSAALHFAAPAELESIRSALRRWSTQGRMVLAALAVATVSTITYAVIEFPDAGVVEITMRVSEDSRAEVFVDSGHGYNPVESSALPVRRRDGLVARRWPLKLPTITSLRLDPIAGSGTVLITRIHLVDRTGRIVASPSLEEVRPSLDIGRMAWTVGGLSIETTPAAKDPQTEIVFSSPVSLPGLPTWLVRAKELQNRVARRIPVVTLIPSVTPLLIVTTLLALGLSRLAIRSAACPPAHVERLRAAVIAGVAAILLCVNLWLSFATLRFYGT